MLDVVAITGIPGAGKTTLALQLSELTGWHVLSTGDIARRVDPASLSNGDLADEAAFRAAYKREILGYRGLPVILDGLPRSRSQVELLPAEGTMVFFLWCRYDIALGRLLRRGRSDDSSLIAEKRIREQSALLEADSNDGWARKLAGWAGSINTSNTRPALIAGRVHDYITGAKRDAH